MNINSGFSPYMGARQEHRKVRFGYGGWVLKLQTEEIIIWQLSE